MPEAEPASYRKEKSIYTPIQTCSEWYVFADPQLVVRSCPRRKQKKCPCSSKRIHDTLDECWSRPKRASWTWISSFINAVVKLINPGGNWVFLCIWFALNFIRGNNPALLSIVERNQAIRLESSKTGLPRVKYRKQGYLIVWWKRTGIGWWKPA